MLNLNSPIVRDMIRNDPTIVDKCGGGIYGAEPEITTEYVQQPLTNEYGTYINPYTNPALNHNIAQPSFTSPYPSPKDMLTNYGVQNVYGMGNYNPNPYLQYQQPQQQSYYNPYQQQTINPYLQYQQQQPYTNYYNPYNNPYPPQQQPQQYVPTVPNPLIGTANPGFQAAFNGYYNPYMGNNNTINNGYTPPMYGGDFSYLPMTQQVLDTIETARNHGWSYEEEVRNQSEIYKDLTRIAGKYIGLSDEEIEERAKKFDVYDRRDFYPQFKTDDDWKEEPKEWTVRISITNHDGEEIYHTPDDFKPDDARQRQANSYCAYYARKCEIARNNLAAYHAYLHATAVERNIHFDTLSEFFNDKVNAIIIDYYDRLVAKDRLRERVNVYARNQYKNSLELLAQQAKSENGEEYTKECVERMMKLPMDKDGFIHGKDGVMPDGRLASKPGMGIEECFSYNPRTGQYNITAPDFIKEREEKLKKSFNSSIIPSHHV